MGVTSRTHSWETLAAAAVAVLLVGSAPAATTVFFDSSQIATTVSTTFTSRTISSGGYLFTYTMDNWWYPTISLGTGAPTGRFMSVFWPDGIQAQAITAGPTGRVTTGSSAQITIRRADGRPFGIPRFTAKLLANTAATGGSFEVMPMIGGEDTLPDPLMFDATGYAGNTFAHESPTLTGADTYKFHLWVDYALIGITLEAADLEPPDLDAALTAANRLRLSWPTNAPGFSLRQYADADMTTPVAAHGAGTVSGTNREVTVTLTNPACFFRLEP